MFDFIGDNAIHLGVQAEIDRRGKGFSYMRQNIQPDPWGKLKY